MRSYAVQGQNSKKRWEHTFLQPGLCWNVAKDEKWHKAGQKLMYSELKSDLKWLKGNIRLS